MRILLRSALFLSAALLAGPGVLQGRGYLSGAAGQASIRLENLARTDLSWRIIGGYRILGVLGLEAGYADLGDVSGPLRPADEPGATPTHAHIRTRAYSLAPLVSVPFPGTDLRLSAVLGPALVDYRIDYSGGTVVLPPQDETEVRLFGGVAATYSLGPALLGLRWDRYETSGGLRIGSIYGTIGIGF